jgi:hypothetical protein
VVQISKGLRRLVHGKKDLRYEMDGRSFCYKVLRVPSESEVSREASRAVSTQWSV